MLGVALIALVVPLLLGLRDRAEAPTVDLTRTVTPVAHVPAQVGRRDDVSSRSGSRSTQPAHNNHALFFGDSYVIGGGYTDLRHSMAYLASKRLDLRSVIRGVGGTGFATANLDYDIPAYLGQVKQGALRAPNRAWVVVEGGLNDRGAAKAKVQKNARKVLTRAINRHSDALVVLVGPVDTDGVMADTRPIVNALRRAARQVGVPFVNAQHWLAGHYDLVGPDHVHPTPAGHRLLGRKLAKALGHRGVG